VNGPPLVRVRIDRLVLDGFEGLDRAGQRRLREAVEHDLARQLRRSLAAGAAVTAPERGHRGITISLAPTQPRVAGAAIARSVHRSIVRSPRPEPSHRGLAT
jgi:hypothetical protein